MEFTGETPLPQPPSRHHVMQRDLRPPTFRSVVYGLLFLCAGTLLADAEGAAANRGRLYSSHRRRAKPSVGRIGGAVNCVRLQDDIWLVSTRRTPHCRLRPPRLKIHHYEKSVDTCGARWMASDEASFLGQMWADIPTVFFVHGNRIAPGEDRERGLQVYRSLIRQASDERPIRFVIWSWPTEKVCGPLRDVRVKAERADPAGYHLA